MKGWREKAEEVLLGIFILLIPTQLGRHFWPEWSQVMGVRVDYLSPVIYLTDIAWVAWVGWGMISKGIRINGLRKIISFEWLMAILYIGLNVIVANNRWVAIYRWIRLGQWWLTVNLISKDNLRIVRWLKWIIPFWVIGESLLGLAQIIKGGSVGGIMYWLGERRFSFASVGIAQIAVLGQGMIRAYGTFSHPNSMAGFLLAAILIREIIGRKEINGIGKWIVRWMGLVGIIIAGSRVVWAILVLGIIAITWKKLEDKKRMVEAGILGLMLMLAIIGIIGLNYRLGDFVGGWDKEGFSKRLDLATTSFRMINKNPMLGVGLGNFIPRIVDYQKGGDWRWRQPVHNVALLAGAEMGILGLIGGVLMISRMGRIRLGKKYWVILSVIFITGMVDHYWMTLPQNSWLLALIVGLIWAEYN